MHMDVDSGSTELLVLAAGVQGFADLSSRYVLPTGQLGVSERELGLMLSELGYRGVWNRAVVLANQRFGVPESMDEIAEKERYRNNRFLHFVAHDMGLPELLVIASIARVA